MMLLKSIVRNLNFANLKIMHSVISIVYANTNAVEKWYSVIGSGVIGNKSRKKLCQNSCKIYINILSS